MKTDLREAFGFLKEYSKVVRVAVILFLALGFLAALQYGANEQYAHLFDQLIDNAVGGIAGLKGASLLKAIFLNNLKASTMAVTIGIVPFIFIPGFNIASNGAVTGAAIMKASTSLGVGPGHLLIFGILPHGIFEIPALVIAASLGIILCREVTRGLLRKPHKRLNELLEEEARCFILMVVPLLILAAVVETYITPMLL
ncbi:MAG: stage II sporulation protein M [Clostridia bacterium]|nr:stage II sporulation protein M [Clostridia bacterium]